MYPLLEIFMVISFASFEDRTTLLLELKTFANILVYQLSFRLEKPWLAGYFFW
jgi:hypothetical protein